jgi:hypothetical protein
VGRSSTYHVAPRYTPGAPAMIPVELAHRIVEEERDGYRRALSGLHGLEAKQLAESKGLKLIVWELRERTPGWHVKDLITSEYWYWPGKAQCTICQAMNIRCRRGYLMEHSWPLRPTDMQRVSCGNRGFVGHALSSEYYW